MLNVVALVISMRERATVYDSRLDFERNKLGESFCAVIFMYWATSLPSVLIFYAEIISLLFG